MIFPPNKVPRELQAESRQNLICRDLRWFDARFEAYYIITWFRNTSSLDTTWNSLDKVSNKNVVGSIYKYTLYEEHLKNDIRGNFFNNFDILSRVDSLVLVALEPINWLFGSKWLKLYYVIIALWYEKLLYGFRKFSVQLARKINYR